VELARERAGASSKFYEGSTTVPPCPALAGTVASGQSPIPSGNAPIPSCTPPALASREAEPPSEAPGGSESLRKILTMPPSHGRRVSSTVPSPHDGVHDGIGALPDRIGLCPLATVPARAGHGGGMVELAHRPCGGIVKILRRLSEPPGGRRWPPVGGPASLEARGGGVHDGIGFARSRPCPQGLGTVGALWNWRPHGRVHDGIGALPDRIGLCLLATVPARAGHGGGTVEMASRPCGGIVKILRRLSEPPGGRRWPPVGGPASLEARGGGVHDGIGFARSRPCPQGLGTVGALWNWRPHGRVHDGIGALPDRIGLCPLATVPARAGHGGGTVKMASRPCGGIVRILRRLSIPP